MTLHPSEILDKQIETHKWYSSGQGYRQLTYQLLSEAGLMEQMEALAELVPDVARPTVEMFARLVQDFVSHVYRGDAVFVTRDILQIAMQAAEDLREHPELVFDEMDLLCPYGFLLFEEGITITDSRNKKMLVSGFVWGLEKNEAFLEKPAIDIWWLTDTNDFSDEYNQELAEEFPGVLLSPFAVSHWYPLELGHDFNFGWRDQPGSIYANLLLFAALHLLSHQKLSETRPERPPRPAVRRAGRWRPNPGYITVITLRQPQAKSETTGEVKVEWSHRWLVGGHWRRHWYPKEQRHKWKYIHEYIKGPKDKPLVLRQKRLFNFRR